MSKFTTLLCVVCAAQLCAIVFLLMNREARDHNNNTGGTGLPISSRTNDDGRRDALEQAKINLDKRATASSSSAPKTGTDIIESDRAEVQRLLTIGTMEALDRIAELYQKLVLGGERTKALRVSILKDIANAKDPVIGVQGILKSIQSESQDIDGLGLTVFGGTLLPYLCARKPGLLDSVRSQFRDTVDNNQKRALLTALISANPPIDGLAVDLAAGYYTTSDAKLRGDVLRFLGEQRNDAEVAYPVFRSALESPLTTEEDTRAFYFAVEAICNMSLTDDASQRANCVTLMLSACMRPNAPDEVIINCGRRFGGIDQGALSVLIESASNRSPEILLKLRQYVTSKSK
ncbi:MAG: hypothetical protein ACKVS6_12835 [Planctomycetota bacterium]